MKFVRAQSPPLPLRRLLLPSAVRAQESYPNKPVKVIVPFAPGGPSDVTARIIFNEMSKNVGKQFYIENHAGAGANIGITLAARAAPDGYTVLLSSSSLWLNPSTYPKVPTIRRRTSSRSRWSPPRRIRWWCIRPCR